MSALLSNALIELYVSTTALSLSPSLPTLFTSFLKVSIITSARVGQLRFPVPLPLPIDLEDVFMDGQNEKYSLSRLHNRPRPLKKYHQIGQIELRLG